MYFMYTYRTSVRWSRVPFRRQRECCARFHSLVLSRRPFAHSFTTNIGSLCLSTVCPPCLSFINTHEYLNDREKQRETYSVFRIPRCYKSGNSS